MIEKKLLCCLFVCLLFFVYAGVFPAQGEDYRMYCVMNALSDESTGSTTTADAMREGVQAAYWNYNLMIEAMDVKPDHILNVIKPKIQDLSNLDNLEKAIKTIESECTYSKASRLYGTFGPYGDDLTMQLSQYVSTNPSFMLISPYTEQTKLRKWNKQTFFARADPRVEMLTLLHYAVNQQSVRRVGFMYISGTNFGSDELSLLQMELKRSFNTNAIVFTQSDQAKINQKLFDDFINEKPEAIIVFGLKCAATTEFINKLVTNSSLANITILAPYYLQETLLATYQNIIDVSKHSIANPTVISGTNPLPSATEFAHVQQFRKEMKTYIEQADLSTSTFTDETIFDKDLILGEAMLSGWIAGTAVIKAIHNEVALTNIQSFQSSLINQKRFIIGGDFVLGDYGANCSKAMRDQGFMCECNQGGHTAFLKNVNSKTNKLEYISNSLLPYDSSKCYPTEYIMAKSIQLLLMSPQDKQLVNEIGTNMSSILSSIVKESNENGKSSIMYNVKEMKTKTASEVTDLNQYYSNYGVDVIFGPLTFDNDAKGICVIDPLYQPLQSHRTETNLIHITPTVEQQIYTLYQFVTNNKGVFPAEHQKVKFILKKLSSNEDAQYRQVIQQTVSALKAPSFDVESLKDGSIDALLDKKGVNFVIGATYEDIQPLTYLISNTTCNASVILTYQDFATLYENITLSTQLKKQSTRRRLFTMSNLPMWTFKSTKQNIDRDNSNDNSKFDTKQNVKANAFTSPREMEMSMLKSFLDEIMKLSSNRINPNFLNTIYTNGVITTNEMQFGPFVDCSVAPDISSSVSQDVKCENRNYGARDIVIFSYEHVCNTAEGTLSKPITPTMNYFPVNKSISSSNIIAIVIAVIAAIIIIALIALLIYYVTYARYVKNALKNSDEPLTIVYIDIDGCTELWASEPEVMPHVVATYYHLVREAIEKHWCYEVKLIGDAFMVACKDANSALQLARDVQIKLLLQDWRTDLIDAAYRRFEETKMAEIPGYESPMLMLDPLQYAARWNGIRARIGMHTGLCTIEYHSEMKGFDYTGETVKNATRITSLANGGQTIMSEDTWYALTREERERFDYNNLETKEIRNVPFPMDIYQLNAIPGRAFPPLRSKATSDDKCFNNDIGMGLITCDDMTMTMSVAGHETAIASVLADCYSVFPTTRRVQEILPLLDKWRVECPAAPADRGEDVQAHYFRSLLSRLASKLAIIRNKRNGFSSNDWAQLDGYQMNKDEENSAAKNRNMERANAAVNKNVNNNNKKNNTQPFDASNGGTNSLNNLRHLFNAARQAHGNNPSKSQKESVQNSNAALEEAMQARSNSVSTIEADSMGVEELDKQMMMSMN